MEWNMTRLRFLFYLSHTEGKSRTISAMARVFGTSKSTISRNMDLFAEYGIVFGNTLELTGHGRNLAEQYEGEVEGLRQYLSGITGKSPEDMTADAMQMLLNLSEETRQSILEKQKMLRFLARLDDRLHPRSEDVLEALEDGVYHLPFTIYRESSEDLRRGYVSMADKGFEHPAVLTVENGNAILCLKALAMEHRSFMEDLLIRGKLIHMHYLSGKEYEEPRQEGDAYYFPLSALSFTYHQAEGFLQGSTKLQMESPMKRQKHVRAAVFTLFFR